MTNEEVFKKVLDCSFKVHTALGPGLLESSYEECLNYELKQQGLTVEKQKPLPLICEEVKLDIGYRIDLIVDDKILIEIKSIETLAPVHFAQTLTYLRLSELKLALLINFNCKILKNCIHRIVNNL